MLHRLKKIYGSENFSYFIRYFAVFTLIFGLMTMIIFQLMRSTMYQSSDENFKEFLDDPSLIVNFALARGISSDAEVIIEQETPDASSVAPKKVEEAPDSGQPFKPSKLRLNSNYHVILYDKDGNIVNDLDTISGLSSIKVDPEQLDEIVEQTVTTAFGDDESYRMITCDISDEESVVAMNLDIHYATILYNTTQIMDSISHYESTVMLVMISFWLISILASIYLARVSLRPLLMSFQKQKDFVENASHELRTPLAVLQNRLESLFRKPEATILESSEKIASSLEEVRNMRILTTNLMNLARRDDGLKPEIGPVAPTYFETIFDNFTLIAEENDRQLIVENRLKGLIYTDKTLLKQVMTILFDNAIKYSEEGGVIRILLDLRDRHLIFSIADDGLGISDADKKKIFDRFYRVDKARTRQKGGFGLGLSLAKQILDILNGSITVKINHPKGSIFEIRLPIKTK